jgi:hypothetical protein
MSFPMGGDWMNYFRTAILICHAKWASMVHRAGYEIARSPGMNNP